MQTLARRRMGWNIHVSLPPLVVHYLELWIKVALIPIYLQTCSSHKAQDNALDQSRAKSSRGGQEAKVVQLVVEVYAAVCYCKSISIWSSSNIKHTRVNLSRELPCNYAITHTGRCLSSQWHNPRRHSFLLSNPSLNSGAPGIVNNGYTQFIFIRFINFRRAHYH